MRSAIHTTFSRPILVQRTQMEACEPEGGGGGGGRRPAGAVVRRRTRAAGRRRREAAWGSGRRQPSRGTGSGGWHGRAHQFIVQNRHTQSIPKRKYCTLAYLG